MADIATLLGTNLGGDDEALVRALRGQVEGGDVLGLSTIGQVSDMGRAQRKRAADAATRGGALRTAAERRKQQAALQAERLAAQAEQNRLGREATAEQGALNRALQETLAKLRRAGRSVKTMVQSDGTIVNVTQASDGSFVDTEGAPVDISQARPYSSSIDPVKSTPKVSAGDRREMAALDASLTEGEDILQKLYAHPEAIRPGVDTSVELAEYVPGVGKMLGQGIKKMAGKTPEEREVRAQLDFWVEQTRRRLAGANLTRIETILGEKWAPSNRSLSYNEVIDRIKIMQQVAQNRRDEIAETYGIEAEAPQDTPPPPAPAFVGEMTLGGKQYGRLADGTWVEIE